MTRVTAALTRKVISGEGRDSHGPNGHVWVSKTVLLITDANRWPHTPPQYQTVVACLLCNTLAADHRHSLDPRSEVRARRRYHVKAM